MAEGRELTLYSSLCTLMTYVHLHVCIFLSKNNFFMGAHLSGQEGVVSWTRTLLFETQNNKGGHLNPRQRSSL